MPIDTPTDPTVSDFGGPTDASPEPGREALERAPAGVGASAPDAEPVGYVGPSTLYRLEHAPKEHKEGVRYGEAVIWLQPTAPDMTIALYRVPRPVGGDAPMSGPLDPTAELGPEDFEPHELWLNTDTLYRFTREYATDRIDFGSDGEWPETLDSDAPLGWSVWEGTRRQLTAEDIADEEACGFGGLGVGDWWWEGSLRPATAGELLGFFQYRPKPPRAALSTRSEEVRP